jgi:hypothetical protein
MPFDLINVELVWSEYYVAESHLPPCKPHQSWVKKDLLQLKLSALFFPNMISI